MWAYLIFPSRSFPVLFITLMEFHDDHYESRSCGNTNFKIHECWFASSITVSEEFFACPRSGALPENQQYPNAFADPGWACWARFAHIYAGKMRGFWPRCTRSWTSWDFAGSGGEFIIISRETRYQCWCNWVEYECKRWWKGKYEVNQRCWIEVTSARQLSSSPPDILRNSFDFWQMDRLK